MSVLEESLFVFCPGQPGTGKPDINHSETKPSQSSLADHYTNNMLRFALLATLAFCLTEAAPSGYGYGYAAPHK